MNILFQKINNLLLFIYFIGIIINNFNLINLTYSSSNNGYISNLKSIKIKENNSKRSIHEGSCRQYYCETTNTICALNPCQPCFNTFSDCISQ